MNAYQKSPGHLLFQIYSLPGALTRRSRVQFRLIIANPDAEEERLFKGESTGTDLK